MGRDGSFTIYPDARFRRWVSNFDRIGRTGPPPPAAVREWETAVEMMFAASQQYVHIDSGDLLSSGSCEIEDVDSHTITGAITYGGTRKSDAKPWWKHQFVDYTKYELERGGSHDFLKRASNATHRRLTAASGDVLKKMMEQERW